MIVTATRDLVADLVRRAGFGDALSPDEQQLLDALGFVEDGQLTSAGEAFDEASWTYSDEERAVGLYRDALLGLPETQALLQGLQGRGPVAFSGAHHLMARHKLVGRADVSAFRTYLGVLNSAQIVSYSNKMQTVRGVAPLPKPDEVTLRVVETERPYSNLLALWETLRSCDDYIWWAEVHMDRKALEPLSYVADSAQINEIRLLSGPTNANSDVLGYFKRFVAEMQNRGISTEWRVVDKRDVDWHDRFIIGKGQVWNVPPVNTLYKGDYSELTRSSQRPPFESWWAKATPLATWVAASQASA